MNFSRDMGREIIVSELVIGKGRNNSQDFAKARRLHPSEYRARDLPRIVSLPHVRRRHDSQSQRALARTTRSSSRPGAATKEDVGEFARKGRERSARRNSGVTGMPSGANPSNDPHSIHVCFSNLSIPIPMLGFREGSGWVTRMGS